MKKIVCLFVAFVCLIAFASCGPVVNTAVSSRDIMGRDGQIVSVPEKIEKIISMGPSNTEMLVALGLGDKIIAIDTYSIGIPGVKDGLPMFDMMNPDAEQLVALSADLIILTGMMMIAGQDPLKAVSDAGARITYIPTSDTIADIIKDIEFIGKVTKTDAVASGLIKTMEAAIDEITAKAKAVTDKKTVYFEISPAPYLYSFGKGVFLDEMISLIGAVNVFADVDSWISVQEENAILLNPDVILTTTDFLDDPVGEILGRAGWNTVTAVVNKDVHYIDANASSRANHNIVVALKQMAEAVYPDIFND